MCFINQFFEIVWSPKSTTNSKEICNLKFKMGLIHGIGITTKTSPKGTLGNIALLLDLNILYGRLNRVGQLQQTMPNETRNITMPLNLNLFFSHQNRGQLQQMMPKWT